MLINSQAPAQLLLYCIASKQLKSGQSPENEATLSTLHP